MGIPRNFSHDGRRIRRDGWTKGKRVTFFVTLAATGSVTFAAASVGMSRKSAYALKKRDSTFASLWDRALAIGGKAGRNGCAEGNEIGTPEAPAASSTTVNQAALDRARADAARDRFFAGLQKRPSAASLRPRIGKALANR